MKNRNNKPSPEEYLRERVRALSIGDCRVNSHWQEMGMAMVLVNRMHKQGTITTGLYQLDTNCRGLIDTEYFFCMEPENIEKIRETFVEKEFLMERVSYTLVHNLVYGAIDFAEEAGIKPHPDFNLTQYILEEDTEDIPFMEFSFGEHGKHYLYADDEKMLNKYLPTMKQHLGDNFGYILKEDYYRKYPEFIGNYIADSIGKTDK